MKIKLITDSSCDLPKEMIEEYNIGLAPMIVTIEGTEYKDYYDIEKDDFYRELETYYNPPTTSMPTPESYIKLFREAEEEGYDSVLCISMSSGTSGTYQSSVLSKSLYFESYEDSKLQIEVIDSVSMSHGSGWLVKKCAMLLEDGYELDALITYCENIKYRIKHFLSVDDLENLIRSGRLNKASALIGKVLNVKPIMTMKKTKGALVAKKRGNKQLLKFFISEFLDRVDYEETDFVIIGYTSDIYRAENLRTKFLTETNFKGEVYILQMGVAVGTHVGLGGLSMYYVEKPHEDFMDHLKESIIERIERQLKK